MTYSLRRTRDGAGDSGPMCRIGRLNPETEMTEWIDGRPRVGWNVTVGSIYSRSFSPQDYWMTTIITEILEDTPEMMRFRTSNSEYIWKEF